MERQRVWRHVRAARTRAILALLLGLTLGTIIPYTALAGTTGVISGTVVDNESGKPLQDVKVTAAAPTGRYATATNAKGFFSIAGVFADTYTLSFQAEGYDSTSEAGVTVFADQTVTIAQRLSKVLQQIARVTSRSISSAYQPTLTVNTTTESTQQIQNIQGTVLNISETNLLTSLPGAMADSSGYPVIHGGRENEEGFEFEGIPYTDALTNQFVNTLALPGTGVSSVQLTPGAGNATTGGSGTGTFNLVANRGTYPGFAEVDASLGGPGYDHRLNVSDSWATPDLHFSDYLAFAGQNFSPIYGQVGTNLALLPGFYFGGLRQEVDRELMNNFVWRFGKTSNQSLQLFVDFAQHNFYFGAGGLTGVCFASCDPVFTGFWGGAYGLPNNLISEMSRLYPGQANAFQTLEQAGDRAVESVYEPNQAFKVEYTNNLNASTFLSVRYYRVNAVVPFDLPSTNFEATGDSVSIQGGQTTGTTLSLTKQLNDENLLELGGDYHLLHPINGFISDGDGFLSALIGTPDQQILPYAFVQPSACPSGAPPCGAAYAASPGTPQLIYPPFDEVSELNAQYYSLFADDKIQFSSKFNAEVGLRYDAVNFNVPNPGVDQSTCTTQFAPATWPVDPTNPLLNVNGTPIMPGNCPKATFNVTNDQIRPKVLQPNIGLAYQFAPDTAVRVTYDRGAIFPSIAQVVFAQNDPTAFVGAYRKVPVYNPFGVNVVPGHPNLGGTCGLVGFTVPCTNLGEQIFWSQQNLDGVPFQPVRPATSDNYQLTLQHQFSKGWLNGVAVSISPWYRDEHDVSASVQNVITQNGKPLIINGALQLGPALWSNLGKEFATGIDLNITRSVPIGLSFQWTATYINEFSSVIPLSSSEDFYPSIPQASLLLGNVYRVGFVSPFQSTLALEYTTKSGWRINPRWLYNVGYPSSVGEQTAALINGVPFNLPNTDTIVGTSPNGPAYFVDPNNPGSVFHPNIVSSTGTKTGTIPGSTLSPANSFINITISYQHPGTHMTYGVDVGNVFNQIYNGPVFNGLYQPIATGVAGPLTGYSTNGNQYQGYPGSLPRYTSLIHGQQVYVNVPANLPRSYYFFIQTRL